MSAQGPLSAPQGCSVSPDNRAALHATASCFAALHATASCFAIGYRIGIASPRPTVCLEFPITIGSTSPLTCSLQERALSRTLGCSLCPPLIPPPPPRHPGCVSAIAAPRARPLAPRGSPSGVSGYWRSCGTRRDALTLYWSTLDIDFQLVELGRFD